MKDLLLILSAHWPSLLLLALSAIPAAYQHLHDHGKLMSIGRPGGFFSSLQWTRKYKLATMDPDDAYMGLFRTAPDNWYYRFFKIKYQERFPLSATLLSLFTDAYHSSQALMRILMSLSITLAMNAPWWAFLVVWVAYATIHAAFYKILS